MITLEELDNHKKGMSEVARNARQVSRELDAGCPPAAAKAPIPRGRHRAGKTGREAGGAVLPDHAARREAARPACRRQGRQPDPGRGEACARRSPGATWCWCPGHQHAREGARALGLPAEDYFNDKTLEDGDLLYTGVLRCPPISGSATARHGELAAGRPHLLPHQRPAGAGAADQPVRLPRGAGRTQLYARVTEITGKTAVLKTLRDYTHGKNAVWGA